MFKIYIVIGSIGAMIGGLTIANNAISGDQVNWILLPIAVLFVFLSIKNFIWLFRTRVVVRDSEITIHLPFAFFKPIQFDGRYILGYGELRETDDSIGTYQFLRVLNENGKVHEIQSFTVPEYDEVISFLKKHHIKNLGVTLFEEELKRRRKFVKRIETVFAIGAVVLFFVMMLFFGYYTFF